MECCVEQIIGIISSDYDCGDLTYMRHCKGWPGLALLLEGEGWRGKIQKRGVIAGMACQWWISWGAVGIST